MSSFPEDLTPEGYGTPGGQQVDGSITPSLAYTPICADQESSDLTVIWPLAIV